MATLLVKNVKIIGGKTEPALRPVRQSPGASGSFSEGGENSCVFISGEKISAIGNFPNKKADEVVDGQGAYLSAGFIDVNANSDHYLTLFDDPAQEDFLKQGITTIIAGQCGSSLAPLLYGSLESVRKWSDTDKVNVNWHSLKEFLDVLEKKRLGVNFATLVGHSTIRRALIGESLRNLTKNELAVFAKILEQSLQEGGFGISTGLGYLHSRETPYQEIKFLVQIVKKYNGVYATHLRKSGGGLEEALEETIKLAEETKIKTIISHFLPHYGEEKEYGKSLEKLSALPPDLNFHFDLYPFDASILPIYTFLPLWAQRGNLEKMKTEIEDDWLGQKIIKDLPYIRSQSFVVAQAFKNDYLTGKTLEELKEFYSLKDSREALLKLMRTTGLRAVVFYKNIDQKWMLKALKHPRSLIATNAASFGNSAQNKILKPERSVSTFTKFLTLAEKENLLPLEGAIFKITREPAMIFGLKNRGEIKEGNFADLAVFKNGEIKAVVVNGRIAVKDGEVQNILAGKILKH